MTPQQLKNSILQQAIEGKLVEQRPEEGNGRDLLKAIQKEKAQLVQYKKIKKEKPLPEIKEEEIPFAIPENWVFGRFSDFGVFRKGPFGSALTKSMFVPKGENTIKVYEQKNAIQKDEKLGDYYISEEYFQKKMQGFELHPGDIIVSCAGTIGETFIMPSKFEKGIINQALMRMTLFPSVYVDYFLLYFDVILKENAKKSSKGSAIKNIPPFEVLKTYLVALPPLEEQKRIVARLAEILPQVEIYAQAYQELQELNSKFPGQLKNSLLQQAIEGKLVEQRPEEGNGRDLLKAIQKEKAQLVQAKKIKKEKPLPEIVEEEIPFEIPENWCWCRLDDAVVKEVKRGKSPTYAIDGTVMVFAQKCNTKYNGIDISLAKYLSDEVVNKYPDSEYMQDKDIVINSTGTGTMGRVGIYIVEKDNKSAVPLVPDSHVTIIRISNNMDAQYVYTVLKSQQSYFESQGDGSTKQKELKAAVIKSLLIPLPPLAEQKRIVAKLEQLLQLCQQLA